MEELNEKVNVAEPMSSVKGEKELPAQVDSWVKVKSFLLQEVKVELTPYQAKVFQEVHDFWHQDVTFKGLFIK